MPHRLIELVEHLPRSTVALLGDFMLDRYVFGNVQRINPEAPVPIVHFERDEYRLGGAGSVAQNLAALGAHVRAVGMIGTDDAAGEVRRALEHCHANTAGLVQVAGRPTVLKMRLLGSSHERTPQQMIRLDFEDGSPADEAASRQLIERCSAALQGAAILCIEDYNKGAVSETVCRRMIELARERNIPVIVDPAYIADYSKYRGATALKLNRAEIERATNLPVKTPEQSSAAARHLLQALGLEAVIVTLNDQGCHLVTSNGEDRHLPSRRRQIADATGAGDMVLAAVAMARLAGATWVEAVAIGNAAAGLEVERLGCVPIYPHEIVQDLLLEARRHLGKQRTLAQLLPELQRHRSAGKRIVFTNGCFDLIHLGHIKYFQFARQQGDLLVVGINTDDSIRRLKGPKRPIIDEHDRIAVLEELESIDYLVAFDEESVLPLISQIKPDVLVKGADYRKDQVVGWEVVESYGGKVALAPLIDGRSTSGLIQRILEAYK